MSMANDRGGARQQPPRQREDDESSKAARDKIDGGRRRSRRGLLIVHTGKGKGKSTAAFGMVMRCARPRHAGRRSSSSSKAQWQTGERVVLERFPDLVAIKHAWARASPGRRRTVRATSPRPRSAWERGQADDRPIRAIACVLLDELNIVLRYDYLPLEEVLGVARDEKPARCCMSSSTGRNAKHELIEIADLVTEMKMVKHPFRDRREGAAGDRVLDQPAAIMIQGTGSRRRQVGDGGRPLPGACTRRGLGVRRSSRRTCRTTRR